MSNSNHLAGRKSNKIFSTQNRAFYSNLSKNEVEISLNE